ncbi:MAG: hypothetical protein FVQ84_15765 [Planctomycetes bacterium]|nr:hypothetical protein [Planctomycetota bacterium]
MAAWFNKKTAEAMAKMAEMAESLKAESLARAEAEEKLRAEIESKTAMERKVKLEAEKMLLAQYNKYSALVERAEAKAKESMAMAGAQVKEAEQKVLSYEVALAQVEEKLSQAKEQMKTEALARVRAEERLKSESEERKRVEAQVEGAMAVAKTKEEEKVHSHEVALTEAQEKVQSHEVALTEAQEKLIEAKGRVKAKAVAKAKHGPKTEIKERQRFITQSVEGVHSFKRTRRHIFHPGNIKRKIILLLVLVIFSALTFAFNVANDPSAAEPGGAMTQEQRPAPDTLVESDIDGEQLNSDVAADLSGVSLNEPASGMSNAPALNYESEDNVTFKVNEEKSVPVSDAQSLTITANPVPLKLTASGGGTNNVVQSSDNNRWKTNVGSYMSYEFSDVTIGGNASIKSVVLFVEHFEEERFSEGKLEWAIGTGWPGKHVVWAAMKAPVHEGESNEAVDAWDITSVVNTCEKINSLQLRIKNNNNVANGKTFVDYAYVVIEYH